VLDQYELLLEALYRGATRGDLHNILSKYQRQFQSSLQIGSPRPKGQFSLGLGLEARPQFSLGLDMHELGDDLQIFRATNDYERMTSMEFSRLEPDVQNSFWINPITYGQVDQKKNPSYGIGYYREIRAAFYRLGYDNPFESFFSQIEAPRFLGKKVLLHKIAADAIQIAEKSLKPDEADNFRRQVKDVGGFVPRPQKLANHQPGPLSNHSFGFAVDIDGISYNPNIQVDPKKKDSPNVIRVLKEITGFDFGHLLAPKKQTRASYDAASEAAKTFQAWLKKALPKHEAVLAKAASRDRSEQDAALRDAAADRDDQRRLEILFEYFGRTAIYRWMLHGMLTLPYRLVEVLKNAGFVWGGEYEQKKDFMHFEYKNSDPRKVVKAESTERPLSDLFLDAHHEAKKASVERKVSKSRAK
jgi:D-alanyl-D-alanine carboxypeptidase